MSEIIVSLSSNSDDREINKYHDSSSGSSSRSSSGGNTADEQYTSRILGVLLEVL